MKNRRVFFFQNIFCQCVFLELQVVLLCVIICLWWPSLKWSLKQWWSLLSDLRGNWTFCSSRKEMRGVLRIQNTQNSFEEPQQKNIEWPCTRVSSESQQSRCTISFYKPKEMFINTDKVMWTCSVQRLELCLKLISITNVATKVAHITLNVIKVHDNMSQQIKPQRSHIIRVQTAGALF